MVLSSLSGSLLVAMPSLADPNFWRSVVLVGVHSQEDGAFGLVINRGLDVTLAEVLKDIGEEPSATSGLPLVLGGGPVDTSHGFVLYEQAPESESEPEPALEIEGDIRVSGSSKTLSDLAHGRRTGRFYLLLGYAGWAPGQLEQEIEDNSWVVAPFHRGIVFDVPLEERWAEALRSIGVEPGTLMDTGSGRPS